MVICFLIGIGGEDSVAPASWKEEGDVDVAAPLDRHEEIERSMYCSHGRGWD